MLDYRSVIQFEWPRRNGCESHDGNPQRIHLFVVFFSNGHSLQTRYQVVVSNILYFHLYLGKISNLTSIFQIQMGWNHQPG